MKGSIYGLVLLILTVLISPAYANWDVQDTLQLQERINTVGFNILNSNRIEHRLIFKLTNRNCLRDMCSDMSSINRTVIVKSSILPFIDSDDELAGILSHQIAHGIDTYDGALRGYVSILNYWVTPNKYDLKADKRAVDYMVNAGYNPLALIIVLNKIGRQYRFDIFSNHTLISRRMMLIYEYIFKKYPSLLVDNDYKDNVYYQNFLLTSRNNRLLLQQHIQNPSDKRKNLKYR